MAYAKAVKAHLLLAGIVAASAWAQSPEAQPPHFQDYPVKGVFKGVPAMPVLETPEERKYQVEISDGVSKGWGVFDGATGKEFQRLGPNFAGHYILVHFGCGELTARLSAAIVDANTGRVYRATIPDPESALLLPYFGVFAERGGSYPPHSFHNFPLKSPLTYRVNSRLLIADISERMISTGGSIINFRVLACGAHYYLMGANGLTLIGRVVSDPPVKPMSCDILGNCK
jgi:hypothetical protein